MNDQLMQEILRRLDILAAKAGDGLAFSWAVMVRKQLVVSGGLTLAAAVLLAVVAVLLWGFANRLSLDADEYDETHYGVRLAAVLAAIISVICLFQGMASLLNPEYYALLDLLHMLGK